MDLNLLFCISATNNIVFASLLSVQLSDTD